MIITILLTILVYCILERPVGWLVRQLEKVDWKKLAANAWDKIVMYSRKAGRSASRVVLRFYYALEDGGMSTLEKALLYAGIFYIAIPGDLLPRRVLGLLGIIDDTAIAAWIYTRVRRCITREVELKVEETLDEWFGPDVVIEPVETVPDS